MVWGSGWPDVGLNDLAAVPDVGQLLDGLVDHAADLEAATRDTDLESTRF
jgi:2-pyrone-4,6-dicarboxylate lactonase